MKRRGWILGLPALGLLVVGLAVCESGPEPSGSKTCPQVACPVGEGCAEGACKKLCGSDQGCTKADACVDGFCRRVNTECAGDAECATPNGCEVTSGAYCEGGKCHYAPIGCLQTAPVNLCRVQTGTCNPTLLSGTCRGQSCCEFAPVWPEGSASAQPACPFAAEDANANGTEDGGENWTGVCSHQGECVGCTSDPQCDDADECTADSCGAGGVCVHDTTGKLNATCTVSASGDGVCVSDGGSDLDCRLNFGRSCAGDGACAGGHCECADATCSTRVCASGDCQCRYGAIGACNDALDDGVNDPVDCDGVRSCYGGACKLDVGQECVNNAACGQGQCECADENCALRFCAPADCDCRYGAAGACTTALAVASDPEDCTGLSGCYAGSCLFNDGNRCSADSQCGKGHCECVDDGCTERVCAPADCVCGYGPGGSCTSPLEGTDPEDCMGVSSCTAGNCNAALGETCPSNAGCASGQCECTNASCTQKVCAASTCTCRYGVAGACTDALSDGAADGGDCDGSSACYGGVCKKAPGAACTADSQCGSVHCECVDAACANRVCAGSSCLCGYGAGGTCGSQLTGSVNDPQDCDGLSGCYAGACKLDVGAGCNVNSDCGSDQCECASADCGSKVCALGNCQCGYIIGGSCAGTMSDGDDPVDCEGTSSCYSGACKFDIGQSCSVGGNTVCGSGQCECENDDCSIRVCASGDCVCKYGGGGSCTTNLTGGVDDPQDCEGTTGCFGGACAKKNGVGCSTNGECGNGQCECADPTCSATVCATADCQCGYVESPYTGCSGGLTPVRDDPLDCTGTSSCYATGCKKDLTVACGLDAECGSGHCECTAGGSSCTSTTCTSYDCQTCYMSPTCSTYVGIGLPDVEECDGSSACYQGECYRECASDSECPAATPNCECADAQCTNRICLANNCVCMYGDKWGCNGWMEVPVDPEDCDGASTCQQYEGCKVAYGYPCTAADQCVGGSGRQFCVCANANCTSSVCSERRCDCGYRSAPDQCTALNNGTDDPGSCGPGGCVVPTPDYHCTCESGVCTAIPN